MKLITLNTWGAAAGVGGLLDFFASHADTDIFCLQEMWNGGEHMRDLTAAGQALARAHFDLMSRVTAMLPRHRPFFHPHFQEHYGLLTLVHERYTVVASDEVYVYKERGYVSEADNGNHARNLQYTTLEQDGKRFTGCNLHGLWNGKGKGDFPERIEQSERVLRFTNTLDQPHVLAGDLNLEPYTDSMAILERAPMRNLVKEYDVTSTRTSHYNKPVKYADYVLTSPGITVHDFQVLPDEVSDHAPLLLTFDVASAVDTKQDLQY